MTGEDFVNHRYIEESNIVDLYLLGKLPSEEKARFEEHFIDCQECLGRLETTRDFVRALKSAAAEDIARSSAYFRVGLLAWLIRRRRWQQAALILTTLLVLVALPTAFFLTKMRRMREELHQAKKSSSDWQRQYEEQQRVASGLEKQLQDAKQNSIDRDIQNERESQARPDGSKEANLSTAPPVFALSIVRSADPGSEPANRISVPQSAPSIVLSLELENDSDVQSYRATISNADNQIVWKASNLKPHSRDTLRINLNSKLLTKGDYQLTLEGLLREGLYVPQGKYSFRVTAAN